MSSKELKKWFKDNITPEQKNMEYITFYHEYEVVRFLASYEYEDSSLLNFFSKEYDDISGDNIKELYPMAASLSEGQKSAVDENVSIYELILNAATANAFNDKNDNATTELMDSVSDSEKESIENAQEMVEDSADIIKETEAISVYEGVDRDVYKGGVAVTSTAENFSHGNKKNWTDGFVENGGFAATTISLGALSIVSLSAAIICARVASLARKEIMKSAFRQASTVANQAPGFASINLKFSEDTLKYANNYFSDIMNPKGANITDKAGLMQSAPAIREDLMKQGKLMQGNQQYVSRASLFNKLKIGFTIFAIVLCIVDIVVTCITLVQYYNRKHDSIPRMIVDMSYNDAKETSYINYKSVHDNNDECGDLNGEGGKQWLALYATKDPNAGNPILAPIEESNINDFKVVHKDSKTPNGYSPLHMFGTPNAAQNLTFADGESGYSYNDKEGGTYLFFKRDNSLDEDMFGAGTAMGNTGLVLRIIAPVIIGIGIGCGFTTIVKKRRKKQ